MKDTILHTIESPADIRSLSYDELRVLAAEIREELIEVTSRNGGHLAPSLGAVELILAIHRVIDAPKDKVFFDVGHQAYAHKLITGRLDRFDSLRTFGGIGGFTNPAESPFDSHRSGHASDSISTALGYCIARDQRGGHERVVDLIGDGSISGGLAFEALNTLGQLKVPLVIVLNDNAMSISRNVGGLALELAHARTSKAYMMARDTITESMSQGSFVSRWLLNTGLVVRDSVKQLVVPGMFFEEIGIKYIGPIDGHSVATVEDALRSAFRAGGPVLIHAVTTKGEGYPPAMEHPDIFHGIGPFDQETGEPVKNPGAITYTRAFSNALIREAEKDARIVAITAAMPAGTGLQTFSKRFPNRFFDVGIAEENAVTMASGIALGGRLPVVAIYSTFLQRSFDEIIVNNALQNTHVVFCVDRAGIVGEDGATHNGIFDIAYLRPIPNMRIMAPSDERELTDAFHTALGLSGPVAIRYPRGAGEGVDIPETPSAWEVGRSVTRRAGDDVAILAVGRMVGQALLAAQTLSNKGISARVVDMRWIKPLDLDAIRAAASCPLVVTIEEGILAGGFGSAVLEAMADGGLSTRVMRLGVEDTFVEQGDVATILDRLGLSAPHIAQRIEDALRSRPTSGPQTIDEG